MMQMKYVLDLIMGADKDRDCILWQIAGQTIRAFYDVNLGG